MNEVTDLLKSLNRRKHMNTQTGEIGQFTQEEVDAINKEKRVLVNLTKEEELKYRSLPLSDRPIARQFDKLLSMKKRNQLTARQIFVAGYKAALADHSITTNESVVEPVVEKSLDDDQREVSNEN